MTTQTQTDMHFEQISGVDVHESRCGIYRVEYMPAHQRWVARVRGPRVGQWIVLDTASRARMSTAVRDCARHAAR